jgi:hypothetical protein
MLIFIACLLALLLAPLCLRGDALHNLLVERTGEAFRQGGFEVRLEHGIRLSDNRTDYVDLFARRGTSTVVCEIETSARYVLVNVAKAEALGLPLWVVVPNRKVLSAVARRLKRAGYDLRKRPIRILLQAEVHQEVMSSFPLFSAANAEKKNEKEHSGRENDGGSRG